MEIAIAGEGEVVIRFIDSKGRTLMQEKLVVSGSPTVEARRIVALAVETSSGTALLAPVLVRQSNPKQRVTFDHENPSRFTRRRCDEIGCATDVAGEAERGCVPPPEPGAASVVLSDDPGLAKLVQEAARKETNRAE
jgi:hypothetical protein